jgi:hypothetical protein
MRRFLLKRLLTLQTLDRNPYLWFNRGSLVRVLIIPLEPSHDFGAIFIVDNNNF